MLIGEMVFNESLVKSHNPSSWLFHHLTAVIGVMAIGGRRRSILLFNGVMAYLAAAAGDNHLAGGNGV